MKTKALLIRRKNCDEKIGSFKCIADYLFYFLVKTVLINHLLIKNK